MYARVGGQGESKRPHQTGRRQRERAGTEHPHRHDSQLFLLLQHTLLVRNEMPTPNCGGWTVVPCTPGPLSAAFILNAWVGDFASFNILDLPEAWAENQELSAFHSERDRPNALKPFSLGASPSAILGHTEMGVTEHALLEVAHPPSCSWVVGGSKTVLGLKTQEIL